MVFSIRRSCRKACVAILFVASAASMAQNASTPAPLGLQDAIVRSLQSNPDLMAFGYELQAQLGRIRQAGARPTPELGVLVENAFGTGTRSNVDVAETTLSLGFLIEHGARQRRVAAAEAGGQLIESETTVRRLDVSAEATRRYLAILTAQEELNELTRTVQLAEETQTAVQVRVRAARSPFAEESRAYAQVARLRLDHEHAEHVLAAARQRLAALWGEREANFGPAQGALLTLPPLEPYDAFRERLERNPEFEMLVSERRVREAEMRVAESRRRPPWQVSAGVRRFEDRNDHAFVLGVTIPLPARAASEGAVATARAQEQQVDARRAALRTQLDSELFGLYQELRHAYSETAVLRDDVLPRMEAAVAQSRVAYERGRYSYMEWATAQRELLDQRRALLEASANVHRFRIEIERLTGAALSGGF